MISRHTDDSKLSSVTTLDDELKDGSTHFINDNITVAPNSGAGVIFCVHPLHSGVGFSRANSSYWLGSCMSFRSHRRELPSWNIF